MKLHVRYRSPARVRQIEAKHLFDQSARVRIDEFAARFWPREPLSIEKHHFIAPAGEKHGRAGSRRPGPDHDHVGALHAGCLAISAIRQNGCFRTSAPLKPAALATLAYSPTV